MDLKELISLWKKQFNLVDSTYVENKILLYKQLLQTENKKYNLTRLDNENDVYQKYFYESVINFNNDLFSKKSMNVLDIGSGSGIPGIILKILFSDINLYIVESNAKKCNFLNLLIKELDLKNVFVFNQRCEDFIKDKIEFFDLITCRAVAELRILLELSIPGLKINGIGYFLKSLNYENELLLANNISKKLEINNPVINTINFDDKFFVSLKYQKTKSTNPIYPRSWKDILNNDQN